LRVLTLTTKNYKKYIKMENRYEKI
jgi:hypothetical protein